MRQRNQNERLTSDFVEVNGIGTVPLKGGGYRDVFVYGYFTKWDKWSFIVHQDVLCPGLVAVSEASTGYSVMDENYYSIEDALHFALPFIEQKRYCFATSVSDVLVKTQTNLLKRNTTNLQTLAIDTALWL